MTVSNKRLCSRFFSTLSNPTRLAIVELLLEKPRNVTEISKALGQDQTMISHNLRALSRCRFVFSERKWRERIYSLNKESMEPLVNVMRNHAEGYCPKRGRCEVTR